MRKALPATMTLLAIAAVLLLTGAKQGSAQNKPCLHGANETRADRVRREKAVELAHEINGAESMARRFGPRSDDSPYLPFDQLRTVPVVPDGFRVQLHTDGMTYSFSVKDMLDPCLYAVFSDQSGDVYQGTPMPPGPRLKLLSQK
jgi:hypothetical protein